MTIKTLTKKQLVEMYKVSFGTFKKWCMMGKLFTEEHYDSVRIFTPKEVEIIVNHLGEPEIFT